MTWSKILGKGYLKIKFDRSEVTTVISDSIEDLPSNVELTVTGEFSNGTGFSGSDTIRVIQGGDDSEEDVSSTVGDSADIMDTAYNDVSTADLDELKGWCRIPEMF